MRTISVDRKKEAAAAKTPEIIDTTKYHKHFRFGNKLHENENKQSNQITTTYPNLALCIYLNCINKALNAT